MDELTRITDDLDVAIDQLQAAALANHDTSMSSETALTNRYQRRPIKNVGGSKPRSLGITHGSRRPDLDPASAPPKR